jgi:2-phosphoglycerate kinase
MFSSFTYFFIVYYYYYYSLVIFQVCVYGFSGKFFFHLPKPAPRPELVLISGCTGTGKSTLGMTIALNQGIVKCISTDSIRQVMRVYNTSDALHRSSYSGYGDPILQWRECCSVLEDSVESLVHDALKRGVSMVLEGVHIIPSNSLLQRWREAGGVALGIVLVITDENAHRELINKRGHITKKGADHQIRSFSRIRAIQNEMIQLGKENNWLQIEQRLESDPIDIITDILDSSSVSSNMVNSL